MTPPLKASGHRPVASTALNTSATQVQTASGHCLSRPTPQPSWPGALVRAMLCTTRCKSSASNLRASQPGALRGGTTLDQHGPCGCRHSGHHGCSLAASKAA